MLVLFLKEGSTASVNQQDLVCYGQFETAVSEVLAKLAITKRFLDTCDRAVADDCCQVCKIV